MAGSISSPLAIWRLVGAPLPMHPVTQAVLARVRRGDSTAEIIFSHPELTPAQIRLVTQIQNQERELQLLTQEMQSMEQRRMQAERDLGALLSRTLEHSLASPWDQDGLA